VAVLDASAILAWLQDEPGSDAVDGLLRSAVVSAVNWSEVMQKTRQHGRDAHETAALLEALGLTVVDCTKEDAEAAAALWRAGRPLSLADRFCIALGARLRTEVVTAEQGWTKADHGVDVTVIC
jgi:PIN domain nuclease of toxin-antitoxin system